MDRGAPFAATGNPFVDRLRQLTRLDETDLAALIRCCTAPVQIRARTNLIEEGAGSKRLHILMKGWACRFKLLPDGRRHITALLLPGDLCDPDGFYLDHRDYGVTTVTACTVVTLPIDALRDLTGRSPAIGAALGFLLAVDNAMLVERSVCLGRRSAREHLAHFLCELLHRLALVGQTRGNGYLLLLTQKEIGDVLGLTAVHVNRVMQAFRSDGVIDRAGQVLVIADWNLLQRIAVFRPAYLHLENVAARTFEFGDGMPVAASPDITASAMGDAPGGPVPFPPRRRIAIVP